MQIYLVFAVIIAIFTLIFSFQNPFPLIVYFLKWEVKGSLTFILIATFISGILSSYLINTISRLKRMRLIARQKKEIATLTKEGRK
jgi:uncharacterized integral membrane protein